MKCRLCGEQRDFLDGNNVCMICKRMDRQGKEVKVTFNSNTSGKEVLSKTGYLDENRELGKV